MKWRITLRLIAAGGVALGLAVLLLGAPLLARAQGPAANPPTFTYQGRLLLQAGQSYLDDVTCNFNFTLWDAPTGGAQVGGQQSATATLEAGYFTVVLNSGSEFGANAFSGSRRYLEVAVKCPTDPVPIPLDSARVELKAAPYALYALNTVPLGTLPWSQITGKPAGFADDVDNINTYTAGKWLALNGNQFNVVTSAILSEISFTTYQRRVADTTCSGTYAIRSVLSGGSVTCATDNKTYFAGDGLILSGTTFLINEARIQRRVSTICTTAEAIRRVNADGTVACEPVPQGEITEVVATTGLTGGGQSGVVTVSVESITTTMLADRAVTTDRVANGAVTGAKLAASAVTSAKIANGGVDKADLGQDGCTAAQPVLQLNGTAWSCDEDEIATFLPGAGIQLSPDNVLSAKIGNGMSFSPSGNLELVLGGNGTVTTVARSDHNHDSLYVQFTTAVPNKDVSGNFSSGFTVNRLLNIPIDSPTSNSILRYNSSTNRWNMSSYTFDIDICVSRQQQGGGQAIAYCGAAGGCGSNYPTVVGGGCACLDGGTSNQVERNHPTGSNGWVCDCEGDIDVRADAMCLKSWGTP